MLLPFPPQQCYFLGCVKYMAIGHSSNICIVYMYHIINASLRVQCGNYAFSVQSQIWMLANHAYVVLFFWPFLMLFASLAPVTPPPHPAQSHRLEIRCMYFILSGPHTYLHMIPATFEGFVAIINNLKCDFPKMRVIWNFSENSSILVPSPIPCFSNEIWFFNWQNIFHLIVRGLFISFMPLLNRYPTILISVQFWPLELGP